MLLQIVLYRACPCSYWHCSDSHTHFPKLCSYVNTAIDTNNLTLQVACYSSLSHVKQFKLLKTKYTMCVKPSLRTFESNNVYMINQP